jgi:hypothetical protein
MKKLLAFFAFLSLGSTQVLASQSNLSQFSAPTAKQRAAELARQTPAKANRTTKAYSTRPHPYTSNPAVSSLGFVSALQIPAGGSPRWTAVSADFNNDGKLDFATPVMNNNNGVVTFSVSVVLSNGNGTFQNLPLTPNPNGSYGDQILVGDVNNDGNQDLIVVHATASTFEVWLGNGDGTFNVQGNAVNTITTNPLDGGALTTINGNAVLIAVDGETPAHVWTVASNGTGTFSQTPVSVTLTGGQLNNIVFDDFNGDGILDFAASDSTSNNQTVVYLGQSNGTYLAGSPLTTASGDYGTCNNGSGDLNGDGKPEIVTANCGFGNLIVYVNNGDGTFQPGVYYAAGINSPYVMPEAVTIADVNGDGKKDIISSNADGSDVTVLLGKGDGTVNLPTEGYSTGGTPHTSALVADFNGDGFADIIVPDDNFSFAYLQGYGDGTFRAATDLFSPVPPPATTRAFAQVIASADLNGDGYPDFVVGNCCDSSIGVTVFLSQPDGTLGAGTNYGMGGSLTSVAIADFNGDGIPDIAALNLGGDGVQIFTGNGDGTFNPGGSYSTGGSNANGTKNGPFNQIVTGDFNKDGHIDIAVANYSSSNVSVLLNNGTGGFATAASYAVAGNAQTIATADVNNDGFLDLVVTDYASPGFVNVLLNQKNGTFLAAPQSPITFAFNYPGNIALGDLDGDGKLDLVVTVGDTTKGTGLAAAKGNGDGTFQTAVLFSTTQQNIDLNQPLPGDVKMGDINGDGKLDLVYSNMGSGNNADYGTVGIFYNTGSAFGTGMFSTPVEYAAGSVVYSLALADVNQDGATDVVMADNYYAGATVLLNASGSGSTIAASANPAIVGTSVSFTATLAATVRGVTAVPTGTVTFLDGSTSLGTETLSGGLASFTTSLAIGTHSITAQYSGDANFHSSTSKLLSEVVNNGTPGFSLTPTSANASIAAGASATFTITSTPVYGYTGTITFNATGCPAKATCVFSPSSVTLSGAAAVPTTLKVSTAAATTSLVTPFHPNSDPIEPTVWASLGGFGLFGLILAGTGKKRSRQMAVVMGMLALMMTFTLFGCGGGNSSSTSTTPPVTTTPGTPAGSYAVTVTATGSGTTATVHTLNVTVVVQ